MKPAALSLLMISMLGCGGATPLSNQPNLAGEWVMMADVLEYPLACGSHGPITYRDDGIYSLWGEVGTWRLKGDVLTEAMTYFDPLHVDRSPSDLNKPVVSTLRWVDPNLFLKRYSGGNVRAFRRCPKRD